MDAFPKVWALGKAEVFDILNHEVEVTEKVDGSQIVFGKDEVGALKIRSKGRVIYDCDCGGFVRELSKGDLFAPAIDYILSLDKDGALPPGYTFYGETLCKPKHNTLAYGRVPLHNIALFGVKDQYGDWLDYQNQVEVAADLDVDVVEKKRKRG